MTQTYSRETNGKLDTAGLSLLDAALHGGRVRAIRATIDYDGQAAADTIVLGELPPGAVVIGGVINATATLGASATIAIGTAATAGKYRAAATFTTANTPTLFGVQANLAAATPLEAPERVIATIGTASAPNSADFLQVWLLYTIP